MKLYWSKSLGHGFRIGGRIGGKRRKTKTVTKTVTKEVKVKKPLTAEQKSKRKLIWGIVLISVGAISLVQVGTVAENIAAYVIVCLALIGGGIALIATKNK